MGGRDRVRPALSWGTGFKVIDLVCAAVLGILLARFLGAETYGVFSGVIAISYLAAALVQFGLPNFVLREVSSLQALESSSKVLGLWRESFVFIAKFSIFAMISVFVVLLVVYQDLDRLSLALGMSLIPLVAYQKTFSAFLRGLNFPLIGLVIDFVVRPASLLALLVGYQICFELDLRAGLALLAVSFFIACITAFGLIQRLKPSGPFEFCEKQIQAKFLLPIAMVAAVQILISKIDILTATLFLSPIEVGIYKVAIQHANVIALPLMVVRLVIGSNFAKSYALGDKQELRQTFINGRKFALITTLPLTYLVCSYSHQIVEYLFGMEYLTLGTDALIILCIGQASTVLAGPAGQLLLMTKHETVSLKWMFGGLLLNLALNLGALSMGFGIIGIAVATAITTFCLAMLLRKEVYSKLGF